MIDGYSRSRCLIREDIAATLDLIAPHLEVLDAGGAMGNIQTVLDSGRNDSGWLREAFRKTGSLANVMRLSAEFWAKGNVSLAV